MKVQPSIWKKATSSISLVLLGSGMALGGNYLINSPQSFAKDRIDPTAAAEKKPAEEVAITVPQNYVSDVVNRVGDSVVRIDATRTVATNTPVMFEDPFFRQFFGSQMPNIPNEQIQRGIRRCPIFPTNKSNEAWDRVL